MTDTNKQEPYTKVEHGHRTPRCASSASSGSVTAATENRPRSTFVRRRSSNVHLRIFGTASSGIGLIDNFYIDDDEERYCSGQERNENRSVSSKLTDLTETTEASSPYGSEDSFSNYGPECGDNKTCDNASQPLDYSGGASFKEYYSVLRRHPAYRAYLISHLCQNLGDWFARIASVLIVEKLATSKSGNDSATTGVALSYMTLARLLPNTFFAPIGGVLADRLDRRHLMISIDILSGIVVLGFMVALHYESLELFYLVTSMRSALAATYYPATTGIVPLLMTSTNIKSKVHGESGRKISTDGRQETSRDLQLAVTMNSWAWGISSVFGGVLAGAIATVVGLAGCYLIDFATYWTSALIIANFIRGDFRVNETCNDRDTNSGILQTSYGELRTLFRYLSTCGFGMLIFLKGSTSFVWGIEDIVGAQFSTVFHEDGKEDEERSSLHMGLLFSTIGLGCMTGPAVLNLITDGRKPYTLQRAWWIGMLFLTSGWFIISLVQTFPQFLAASFFRTVGSGTAWVYSSLILQTLSDPKVLGRVLAAEYMLMTLFEAASVSVTGRLSKHGFSRNMLALFGASLGTLMLLLWGTYHALSLGAAHPRFNNNYELFQSEVEETLEEKEIEIGPIDDNNVSNSSASIV